jgi:hypothetical protein
MFFILVLNIKQKIKMKNILFLTTLLFYTFSYSQDLNWDKSKGFEVTFNIDNVYTSDGINWEMSVSGQAGPYGMGYGTIRILVQTKLKENTQDIFGLKLMNLRLEEQLVECGKKMEKFIKLLLTIMML